MTITNTKWTTAPSQCSCSSVLLKAPKELNSFFVMTKIIENPLKTVSLSLFVKGKIIQKSVEVKSGQSLPQIPGMRRSSGLCARSPPLCPRHPPFRRHHSFSHSFPPWLWVKDFQLTNQTGSLIIILIISPKLFPRPTLVLTSYIHTCIFRLIFDTPLTFNSLLAS